MVKDYQNKPALLVTLEYTNKTGETTSFSSQCWVRAFQDGVELDHTGSPDFDLGRVSANLRPNARTTVYELIRLDNEADPVEVELIAWDYFDDGPSRARRSSRKWPSLPDSLHVDVDGVDAGSLHGTPFS